MMERKKREIHGDLPKRSDPNYMKAYSQKMRPILKERNKQKLAEKKKNNPNYWKDRYKPELAAKYREKNRKQFSERQWKKRGIIDLDFVRFEQELEIQNNNCKICNSFLKNPQADHDHYTGKFRGILCVPCNNGLGVYEKKKELFENYLQNHRIAK